MIFNGRHLLFSFCIAISVIIGSCTPYVKMSSENLAPSYQEDYQSLCSFVYLQHRNDSLSDLVFELNPDGFLYKRDKPTESFKANATVRVVLFDFYSDTKWTDSTGMFISFVKDSVYSGGLHYSLPLKINTGRSCIAYISIRDDNKENRQTVILPIDKSSRLSSQWFAPVLNITRIPSAFVCNRDSMISLTYNGASPELMKCFFYKNAFPVPSPPYVLENIMNQKLEPDSTIDLSFQSDKESFSLKSFATGIYFFTADPEKEKGFAVICTENGFPDVNTHDAMMNPIRYISTQKEFKKIADAQNKVVAIEEFWLKIGGQEEHTRNLIRKYYSRVTNANRLFTSYTEGWQTDRGMIYIVFGTPNIVYRGDENESWIYGEENNFFSITFTFKKVTNKFNDNDYTLQRAPIYKDNWFRAVDIWRQ